MDVSGIGNYADYLSSNASSQAQNAELKSQLDSVKNSQNSDELFDACKQFEAYLWEQVYKSMQKSVEVFGSDDDEGGYATNLVDYFQGTAIQEIATRTTDESGGANSLAQTLYEQMKRNYGITD